MIELPPRPTYAVIHLDAIQHNLIRMQEISGTQVMAVVKANAYGHGAEQVAQAAAEAEISWFGVAFAGEGLHLRKSGLRGRILVLGYTPAHLAAEAIENDLSLTVYDLDLARHFAGVASSLGKAVRLHIKVETGMGRLGLPPHQAVELIRAIRNLRGVVVEGVFTHFATADASDPAFALQQLSLFQGVVDQLEAGGIRPEIVHAANSAGGLRLPGASFDLVRMGIAMYGLHPSSSVPTPPDFHPALEWFTTVSQVKTMPPGTSVSYGRIYFTQGEEQFAVLPVGYADGYRRNPALPPSVIVHGKRAPVVGRICMDQMMVNVSGIDGVREGDEVVLIGRQGGEQITAEEVAAWWDTINYEVVSGIMARVPRIYKGG